MSQQQPGDSITLLSAAAFEANIPIKIDSNGKAAAADALDDAIGVNYNKVTAAGQEVSVALSKTMKVTAGEALDEGDKVVVGAANTVRKFRAPEVADQVFGDNATTTVTTGGTFYALEGTTSLVSGAGNFRLTAGDGTADPALEYGLGTDQTFTAEADDDLLTVTAHGYVTGDKVMVKNSGGALPTGLSAATEYFVVKNNANTFKLATSLANAIAGTTINLTTDGTGTNTVYKILADQTVLFKVEGFASLKALSASAQLVQLGLMKNASIDTTLVTRANVAAQDEFMNLAFTGFISLAVGDKVQLALTSDTNSDTVEATDAHLVLTPVPGQVQYQLGRMLQSASQAGQIVEMLIEKRVLVA